MNMYPPSLARCFVRNKMAWLSRLCGCVMLCLGMVANVWATEPLTVISDDNYPPYLFKDANGNTVGILADIWKLWEKKTGVKVVLVSTAWEQAQQQLLSGHADVIEMIFKKYRAGAKV